MSSEELAERLRTADISGHGEYSRLARNAADLIERLARERDRLNEECECHAKSANRWMEKAIAAERERDEARRALADARLAAEDLISNIRDEFGGWSNETAQLISRLRAIITGEG